MSRETTINIHQEVDTHNFKKYISLWIISGNVLCEYVNVVSACFIAGKGFKSSSALRNYITILAK